MRSDNKVVAIVLLLMVVAGATLQIMYWGEPRGGGARGVGQLTMAAALIALALFAPQSSKLLHSTRYNWKLNALLGLIVIVVLAVLLWVVYARYYGLLMQSVNSGGDL